jgi:capsular polysaccharide biosynthesis protein/DNA uptake protein ComE-like DNA-binding protein
LAGLLEAIRRRPELVAACTLIVPAIVLVVSLLEQPTYEATATIEVPAEQAARDGPLELAGSDEVASATAERMAVDPALVSDSVVVEAGDAPDEYTVEASADTPTLAARIARGFADELVDASGGGAGGAEVVEAAEAPDAPVSPRTVRNTLIGLVAGLLVGVVAALVANARDRRVPKPVRPDETAPIYETEPTNEADEPELARETGETVQVEAGAVPIDDARSRRSARPPEPERSAVPPPEPDGPVDVNEVTYEELRGLDLTMTQARRLLAYRDRHGGFSSLSDIDEVPGFPEYVREDLKRRVSL